MLRLTLRSGADGRVAARIVDRDGTVFVLDHGDPAVVGEASKLVLHGGFEVRWQDTLETAVPGGPGFLQKLALHYATRGWLVAVEEPDWPRQGGLDPLDAPRAGAPRSLPPGATPPGALRATPLSALPIALDASLSTFEHTQSLLLDDPLGNEPDTEILSRSELLGGDATSGALAALAPRPRPAEEPTLQLPDPGVGSARLQPVPLAPEPERPRIDHDAPTEERPRR